MKNLIGDSNFVAIAKTEEKHMKSISNHSRVTPDQSPVICIQRMPVALAQKARPVVVWAMAILAFLAVSIALFYCLIVPVG